MTTRWLLLALGLGLSALSGCAVTGSSTAPVVSPQGQNGTTPTTTTSPYAQLPGGQQQRPVDASLPLNQPEVKKPSPAAEPPPVPPPPPADPGPPTPPVSPTPSVLSLPPAPVPAADPPVVQALSRACKLELAGQHAAALQVLRDAGLHDSIARLLLASAIHAGGLPSDLGAFDGMLPEIKKLEQDMQARAPLTLNKACFCKRILGFGLYDPLPEKDLPAFLGGTEGRPGERVLLYLEVGNFQAVHTTLGDGTTLHETMLTGSLQIKSSGLPLSRAPVAADIKIPREVRPSRSPRQDYFMRLEFNVPPGLAPGTYTLEVRIEDETPPLDRPLKTRQASRMLEFRVVEAR